MKKLRRSVKRGRTRSDLFESLHDDLVISILCRLSSTATSPSEFFAILITCKRLKKLGLHPLVLSQSCSKVFAVRAKNWCNEAHQFLKLCVNAGNKEAYYTLGMVSINTVFQSLLTEGKEKKQKESKSILCSRVSFKERREREIKHVIRFYCLQNRVNGASLLARAAMKSYAPALYSLALIQFNGSGGLKNEKDLCAGVALCLRAAFLGHIDAIRELGHCFQDGYGVRKNIPEGRRLLVQANARELASVLHGFKSPSFPSSLAWKFYNRRQPPVVPSKSIRAQSQSDFDFELFSDYGFNIITREMHPVNKFMVEWFGSKDGKLGQGLRMCSYEGCGRPETRRNEFRRCSGCGKANYCSRGCQAHDWRVRHKVECAPMEEWMGRHANDGVEEDVMNGENVVMDDQPVQNEQG
ncbi:putative Zinc finger, MYND-type [Helianthus anomalus]